MNLYDENFTPSDDNDRKEIGNNSFDKSSSSSLTPRMNEIPFGGKTKKMNK